MKVTARAHTNIALIKYWGKRDKKLFLPYNSSLSLTLDAFYTDTTVSFINQEEDVFLLNGEPQSKEETQKISTFIQRFRDLSSLEKKVKVESWNHVPTAAGLASSASAYAALAMALNELFQLSLSKEELSIYARQGSGSSTRSLFGGFVEWQKGTKQDGTDSYAVPILAPEECPVGMIFCLINQEKKKISSREGMNRTVETSPFYSGWVESAATDLVQMKKAIAKKDISMIGELTEKSALKMHATTLGANPPFTYLEPFSWEVIRKVQEWRQEGHICYATMDAGPNVKILCPKEEISLLQQKIKDTFPNLETICSLPGSGAQILSIEKNEKKKGY